MKKVFLVLFLILGSNFAQVSFASDSVDYLKEALDHSLPVLELEHNEDAPTSILSLNRVRFRMRGKVGLGVPFLLKFEVRPYIELFFVKEDD